MHRTLDPMALGRQLQLQLSPCFVETPIDPRDLIDRWFGIGHVPDEHIAKQLIEDARRWLSIQWDAESPLERSWQRESATGHGESVEAIESARSLLSSSDAAPIQKLRDGIAMLRGKGFTETELFRKLSLVAGENARPILILASEPMERWLPVVRFVASAMEMAAEARVMVVVDPPGWDKLRELLDSHTAAILAHALVDVDKPAKPVLRYAEEPDLPAKDPSAPQPVRHETANNLQARAKRAVQIARSIPTPTGESGPIPEEFTVARSLAEALLYDALQARPITRDLFALNADGGFMFGTRNAEIDLFCPALRIAIEVDGYFHFQDNNAYRRDRAKDFLMQAEGLLVLRFLAEDVVDRLDSVLAGIFKAVKLRQLQG